MEYFKDDLKWDFKTRSPLRIIIVGAGVAGLTAGIGLVRSGHKVTILEQVEEIAEVGAGIQLAPNNTRILGRFGILEDIMKDTNLLESVSLRRWKNNEELGTSPMMPQVAEQYKAPSGVIHRGDLQRILLEHAKKAGVDLRTGCQVKKADEKFEAKVQLSSGQWIEGDVVIAADGIKSDLRHQILKAHNHIDRSESTGDAAYRILIPKEKMKHDERALELLRSNVAMRWMGPGGHIMGYPIKNNQVYNMVLLHPQKAGTDSKDAESWTQKGDKQEMLEFYKEWNDTVRDLLSYVPEGDVMEWTLNSHRPLPSWHENKIILVGDSCHPMLPYVAQGAAQAMEDAGVLTSVFSLIASPSEIPMAIKMYEHVRKSRGQDIQASAATVRHTLHLPDGKEQQERDQKFRAAQKGQGENPDLWSNEKWENFMWGTDVMKDVIEGWADLKSKL